MNTIILSLFLFFLLATWLFKIQNKLDELINKIEGLNIDLKEPSLEYKKEENNDSENDYSLAICDIDDKKDAVAYGVLSENSECKDKESRLETNSFEKLFLGNIFNKIGAFAIFIGVIVFAKIASQFIIFTAVSKTVLGFLFGLILVLISYKIPNKTKKLQNYSEVLLGTGFGVLFITTYCASTILKLFSAEVSFLVSTAILIAVFFLADKLKTTSMLVLSLVAGYLNPFFIWHNKSEPVFLMAYLLFVNAFSVIYSYKNQTKSKINIINLFATTIVVLCFVSKTNLFIIPAVIWLLYFVFGFVMDSKQKEITGNKLNVVNHIAFLCIIAKITDFNYDIVAYSQVILCFVYTFFVYMAIKKNKPAYKNYLHLALIAFNFYVLSINNGCFYDSSCTTIWSLEAILLTYFACKSNYRALSYWAVGIWTMAFCSLIPNDDLSELSSSLSYTPFWNKRLFAVFPVLLSSVSSYLFHRRSDDKGIINIREFFKLSSISLFFIYLGFEINNTIAFINIKVYAYNDYTCMINSILGFIYSIILYSIYKMSNTRLIKYLSEIFCFLTMLYLLVSGFNLFNEPCSFSLLFFRFLAFAAGIFAFLLYKKTLYNYIAVVLGFILIHQEILNIIVNYHLDDSKYLISICWILYSGIITLFGIFKNKEFLKLSGIVLCVLSVIRIFIFDLSSVDITYKFISFLTLGIILMVLSYIYNKRIK